MVVRETLPAVVVSAGPIGLVAAAHLAQQGLPFLVGSRSWSGHRDVGPSLESCADVLSLALRS